MELSKKEAYIKKIALEMVFKMNRTLTVKNITNRVLSDLTNIGRYNMLTDETGYNKKVTSEVKETLKGLVSKGILAEVKAQIHNGYEYVDTSEFMPLVTLK